MSHCVLIIALALLSIVDSEANEPLNWKSDLQKDCPQCLLTREFVCHNGSICESGEYRDNLYLNAFVNNCFGNYFLNSDDIDEFFRLLYSNQTGWNAPLEKLTNILERSGLWDDLQYASRLKCANMNDKGTNKRFHSITSFHCPINSSYTWKEEFKYCGEKDSVAKYSNCICVENIGVIIKTTSCLTEQGYVNKSCGIRSTIACECPLSDATKSPINQTRPTKPTTPKTNDTGYRAALIVLCLFVIILLVSIISYCIWKLNKKDGLNLPLETAMAAHHSVSHVPMNQEDGYFNVTTPPPSSIYQTIGNNSDPPDLPLRLFSLSSAATDSMRSRPVLPLTPRNNDVTDDVIITSSDDQKYASIKSNKEYDHPGLNFGVNSPTGVSPWGENNGEYEVPLPGPSLGDSHDERLNPLYASEDEMTDH